MTADPAGAPPPLSPQEEAAWRALGRALLVIPRQLDADLIGTQGLSMTEYSVLSCLSEAPARSLRMTELASRVSITVSGLTRVIERLSRDGLVDRIRDSSDGRGQVAVLTGAGLTRLQEAWPAHLASVRRHVLDHLSGLDLIAFARAVAAIGAAQAAPPVKPSRRARPG
jgi:DNA-binding MarR family transcriptional regulator